MKSICKNCFFHNARLDCCDNPHSKLYGAHVQWNETCPQFWEKDRWYVKLWNSFMDWLDA